MAERFRIKKGDRVIVNSGSHKGKTGEVDKILRETRRALVKGVNIVKKHQKPSQDNPGGIIEKELPLHLSNLSLIDPESGKPTRIRIEKKGSVRQRVAVSSGKVIE